MVTKTRRLQLQAPLPAGNLLTLTGGGVSKRIQLLRTEVDPFPPDTETMIYHAENLDSNVEYTDFTITSSNRAKIGYTDDTTDLYIPAAFLDAEDGKWYKVVGIKDKLGAFANCSNLVSAVMPDTITYIGGAAMRGQFFSCDNLEKVAFSHGLETWDDFGTFNSCGLNTKIVLPVALTEIPEWAFMSCVALPSISIPASVTDIGSRVFENCASLASIEVDTSNDIFCSIDGVLFTKDMTQMLYYPNAKSNSYDVPNGVTELDMPFRGCADFKSVTIPDSVTSITFYSFDGTSLESAVFENPNGWYYADEAGAASGTAVDFSDPATAAQILVDNAAKYFLRS